MAERRPIPVYLSLEDAAEAMSVSVKTIRRWIAAGTLPGVPLRQARHPDQARGPGGRASADPVSAVVMPENVESAVIDCASWPNRPTSSTW